MNFTETYRLPAWVEFPREESRGQLQDLVGLLQFPVLPAQLRQLVTLGRGQSLREWGARAAERKAPMLAEQWLAAGRDAARTLLDEPDDWTAEELAGVVGAGVYRMIRQA